MLFVPLLAAALLFAQEVPANDGWVTDRAGMLTPSQERTLEELMESYRAGTTHEIALLTLPDLGGRPIETVALETARAWGLGGEEANDGALLVVAQAERKMRIEVGRGLEGNLTDSIAGRIIRDVIRPRFKAGDYYSGVHEGLVAVHAAIGGDYGPVERSKKSRGSGGEAVFVIGVIAMFAFIGARSNRRRRRGLGGAPWVWGSGGMGRSRSGFGGFGGGFGGGGGGGGFGGFGGGGGFSGGGASGGW